VDLEPPRGRASEPDGRQQKEREQWVALELARKDESVALLRVRFARADDRLAELETALTRAPDTEHERLREAVRTAVIARSKVDESVRHASDPSVPWPEARDRLTSAIADFEKSVVGVPLP
jgi:hypothetical protein